MFQNVGKSIRVIVLVLMWIGIFGTVTVGAILAARDAGRVLPWFLLFGGPVVSILLAVPLYGFGELIENSSAILEILRSEK